MGITNVSVELNNPRTGQPGKPYEFLVDSGVVYSVVPSGVLDPMGIAPTRRMRFSLFGEADDVFLLGAVTLETLALVLDPFKRELRPARLMLA